MLDGVTDGMVVWTTGVVQTPVVPRWAYVKVGNAWQLRDRGLAPTPLFKFTTLTDAKNAVVFLNNVAR
jgi:hypothetical protein